MTGCFPEYLRYCGIVGDTKASRILWVKCATSAECKTIRIDVSTVMDSWVVLLKLCPEFYFIGESMCVMSQGGDLTR